AGDLFTLFFSLEIMSWAPFFLLLFGKSKNAMAAAIRYILWHHVSGLLILSGILIHVHQTGSIEFTSLPWGWDTDYPGSVLMLSGFVINSATVPFHSWLSDTYSEASPGGSVYMTAFTTKTAVFCMITAFAGVELLIWMGVISAVFAVFMAVLENDGRRLLSYHIVSQVGYMVAGVGIGTQMAVNGAAAHAFCHILYKALLYMGAGCVLTVAGTVKFHKLGGLYKYMPISFWLTMIGAFSISGFPLFSGFISKTMTIEASELAHLPVLYLLLETASIGTFLHTGLKLPWNIWFQGRKEPPAGIHSRLKESAVNSPVNMLAAMGILSGLSVFIGIFPDVLYALLPYPVTFVPYTTTRVFTAIQLFIFTFLGFRLLRKWLGGHPAYVLDTDWPVRILGARLMTLCKGPVPALGAALDRYIIQFSGYCIKKLKSPRIALFLTPGTIGHGMLIIAVLFIVFLIFSLR
ncbi:MAG: Na(+)/H(+) antiporter subunit D, partial [Desulfobacterales bacterium]|nr:Na(+)/H(+) antiporter subunit D [Desulfobacterales bacterium]